MQEWLKDKKNLPIVAGLLVVVLLAAGGLVAFELGLFPSGTAAATAPPVAAPSPVGSPPGSPRPQLMPPGSARPVGSRPGIPAPIAAAGKPSLTAKAAAAGKTPVAEDPDKVNPAVGPDPFFIAGGQKKLIANAEAASPKLPLRDAIAPLNLFRIHPPVPPTPPISQDLVSNGTSLASNYRLAGVITGSDGINAILEVGGQAQSVKPGDALPDGSRVQDIQTNSLTLRTAGGTVISLPLSAGNPDQGATNLDGQSYPNGQPFNPQGQGRDN